MKKNLSRSDLIEELARSFIESCGEGGVPANIAYAAAGSCFLKIHILLGFNMEDWLQLTKDMTKTLDWKEVERWKEIQGNLEKTNKKKVKKKT